MARYRTIKEGFWTNEKIVSCSRDARLLFIGMLNFADDGGRSPLSYLTLKMQIFPNDNDISSETIRRLVGELSSNGLLHIYEVEGRNYYEVVGFHDHQKVDKPTYRHPAHTGDVPKTLEESRKWRISVGDTSKTVRRVVGETSENSRRTVVEESATPRVQNRVEQNRIEKNNTVTTTTESVDTPAREKKTEPAGDDDDGLILEAQYLSIKIWDSFGMKAERGRYAMTGAKADQDLIVRWLKAGFTKEEILGAVQAVAVGAKEKPTNFVAFISRTVPERLERFRKTGGYHDTTPPPKSRPTASAANPSEVDDNEEGEVTPASRAEGMKIAARTCYARYIRKGGKSVWDVTNAGPKPGERGHLLTSEEHRQIEIECGVRDD